jgi:hypothetical protein
MSWNSECCGAEPHSAFHFDDEWGLGICGACLDQCTFEEWQEGADPEMKHWENMISWRERFSGD